jgi:integrase
MVTLHSRAPVRHAAASHVADVPAFAVRETTHTGPPKPRLLDRVRHALQARHGSRRTEKAYVAWIRRYILFHGKRHPADMGAAEITQFLTSLAVDGNVAASYPEPGVERPAVSVPPRAGAGAAVARRGGEGQAGERLPVVLSRAEVRAILRELQGPPRLMAILLYGAGLRLLECARLRVKNVDFAANQIVVRAGKGDRDRMTMLPGGREGRSRAASRVRESTARDGPPAWRRLSGAPLGARAQSVKAVCRPTSRSTGPLARIRSPRPLTAALGF